MVDINKNVKIKIKKILDISYWVCIFISVVLIFKFDNKTYGIVLFIISVVVIRVLHKVLKIPFKDKIKDVKENYEEEQEDF